MVEGSGLENRQTRVSGVRIPPPPCSALLKIETSFIVAARFAVLPQRSTNGIVEVSRTATNGTKTLRNQACGDMAEWLKAHAC